MTYATEWKKDFIAKNGKKVKFRSELSTDTEMLWQMFSTLTENTVSNLVPPFTRERIEGWTHHIDYNEALSVVVVIEEPGFQRIIGSATLKFNPQEVFKHKAELGICLHDDFQNLGIGTALLTQMLNIAKMKGIKKVWLVVSMANARAFHLYTKAGFKIEGTLRKETYLDGRYRDEYRMALFFP
jgi:L-phenylalanine/L-methionine N-acetyltransferase